MLSQRILTKPLVLTLLIASFLMGLSACQANSPTLVPSLIPTLAFKATDIGCGIDQAAPCTDPTSNPIPTDTPKPNLRVPDRVGLKDARQALDDQSAVFVDVRSIESHNELHIPGALSMPLELVSVLYKDLNPNDWIILYCT